MSQQDTLLFIPDPILTVDLIWYYWVEPTHSWAAMGITPRIGGKHHPLLIIMIIFRERRCISSTRSLLPVKHTYLKAGGREKWGWGLKAQRDLAASIFMDYYPWFWHWRTRGLHVYECERVCMSICAHACTCVCVRVRACARVGWECVWRGEACVRISGESEEWCQA